MQKEYQDKEFLKKVLMGLGLEICFVWKNN